MATASVPPVSAPAAPAAASSPAVSTPVSTPTPSTPEVSTPVSSPAQPQSIEDRLSKGWTDAKAAVATEEAPPAEVPAEAAPVTETPTETPAEGADEVKETPAAETETPTEEATEFTLDDGVAADPSALAKELKADPAAEKFFNDRPDLKNKVFAALRRDTENREIRQYIPDVETAKTVTKAASTFQQIDNRFLDAHKSPENAQEFLNHWVREAMIVDDAGQPVMKDGKYELHPSLPAILSHITTNNVSVWQQQMEQSGKVPAQLAPVINGYIKTLETKAKATGDERLQAVVDILKGEHSPSPSAQGEYPDELKPLAESLKAQKAELDKRDQDAARQQQDQEKVAHQQSIDRAETKAAESVQNQLKPAFARSGLSERQQKTVLRNIGEAVDAKLAENQLYQSIYDSILRKPPSEAREKELMKHMLTYTNEILGPIVTQEIRAETSGTVSAQAARHDKVESQKKASATEPRGSSLSVSAPPAKTSNAQIIEDWKASHGGAMPSQEEILGEALKRVGGIGARRA